MSLGFKRFLTLLVLLGACLIPGRLSAAVQQLYDPWYFFHASALECQNAEQHVDRWQLVDLNANNRYGSEKGLIGCFVTRFKQSQPLRKQWLYIDSIRHSDISWLNGVEIGRAGYLNSPWQFEGTKPQNLYRMYPVESRDLKANSNILAIATSMGFSRARFAMFPGGSGLLSDRLFIGDAEDIRPIQQSKLATITIVDSIVLTLSFVDIGLVLLLYWISLITLVEFPAVAAGSIFMSLGIFGIDLPFLYLPEFRFGEQLYMLATLLAPPVYIYYFYVVYGRLPAIVARLSALAFSTVIAVIIWPNIPALAKDIAWLFWCAFCAIGSAYALVAGFRLILLRRIGAIPAFVGIIFFVALTPTHIWPNGLWHHYNIQVGTLVFRYCMLLSVLLRVKTLHADRQAAFKALISSAETARTTISRELHDGVGQNLAAAKLHLSLLTSGEQGTLQTIRAELDSAVLSLRRAINGYSDRLLESNSLFEAIALDARRLELIYPVEIQVSNPPIAFSAEQSEHLFRIFQECSANAIKHGGASKISVHAHRSQLGIMFAIADNGSWKTPEALSEYGHGQQNIALRAKSIGGDIQLSHGANEDTVVSLWIPPKH